MNISLRTLLVAGVMAVILGATWWKSHGGTTTREAAASTDASALTAAQPPNAEAAHPVRSRPAGPADSPQAFREERMAQVGRIADAGRQQLLTRYKAEPVDAAWSAAMEQQLLRAGRGGLIDGADANPRDMQVDCRASVCRIEAGFDTITAAEDWTSLFALAAGAGMSRAAVQRTQDAHGLPRVEIYALSR